jgi:hypothetical protein
LDIVLLFHLDYLVVDLLEVYFLLHLDMVLHQYVHLLQNQNHHLNLVDYKS